MLEECSSAKASVILNERHPMHTIDIRQEQTKEQAPKKELDVSTSISTGNTAAVTPPEAKPASGAGPEHGSDQIATSMARVAQGPAASEPGITVTSNVLPFDMRAFAGKKPSPVLMGLDPHTDSLTEGINVYEESPLNLALPSSQPCQNSTIKDEESSNPVVEIMALHQRGVDTNPLLAALNKYYAVVRYGGEIQIASTVGQDIFFMKPQELHKMYGNVRVKVESDLVEVTRVWWRWSGRRQYLRRGVVFEPGGSLEAPDDMLNLWRGFGIEPKEGDWSLMKNHILNVVCSGKQADCDYLLKWMAYAVQRPNEPIGVAVAFRGAQGAGKGVLARTFGSIFGKHFAHIANGEQLTGRFNANLATSCAVFLDEALWAGDKKAEGVLKALITEPRLQLEAKFRDPIMVDNRLRIMVASNNDWLVPAGIGDRRWFVLDVANTFAGTTHSDYWAKLYTEVEKGGAAAMFHDLLAMDLNGFDVRAVPHTAAKAQQQIQSLPATEAWLHYVLQEGEIGSEHWQDAGLTVSKDHAYRCYEEFCKQQRAYRPETKPVWSRKVRAALGGCLVDTRANRIRSLCFPALSECRRQFEAHTGTPSIDWQLTDAENGAENVNLPLLELPRRALS
jgi:hypothetical protein